jgi:hypothetical protein
VTFTLDEADLLVRSVNAVPDLVKALNEIANTAEGHQCRIKARAALAKVKP